MYSAKEIDTIFKKIILEISIMGRAIRNILKDDGMPTAETFYKWLEDDAKTKQYARACEERSHVLVDEMMEISDNLTGDVNRDKLRVDTRKWTASKLKPKKYGDTSRVNMDLTSKGKELKFTDEERNKRIEELLKKHNAD